MNKTKKVFLAVSFVWITGCVHGPVKRVAQSYEAPIFFFNIADPIITQPTEENSWRLTEDGLEIMEDTIQEISDAHPDFVLFSGDVFEGKLGGVKNLDTAYRTLSELTVPWFVVPGELDHLNKNPFFAKFIDHGPTGEHGYWKKDLDNLITLIGLDTAVNGRVDGWVDPAQLQWFDNTLKAVPQGRTIIVVAHHPLIVFNKDAPPNNVLSNYKEVRSILNRYNDRRIIVISGHTHTSEYQEVNGIPYIGSPSISSWPNRYTRFELSDQKISWEHLEITYRKLVAESWKNLVSDSPYKKFFKTNEALKAYFLHAPMEGEFVFGSLVK